MDGMIDEDAKIDVAKRHLVRVLWSYPPREALTHIAKSYTIFCAFIRSLTYFCGRCYACLSTSHCLIGVRNNTIMQTGTCPLCGYPSFLFYKEKARTYFECSECKGISVERNRLPGREEEKARYCTHNNDVNDPRYQQFAAPIVNTILDQFTPLHRGLDFGAGPGPVICKLLTDQQYQIVAYDPFFFPHQELLDSTYDYIVCSEVVEHFHYPDREFKTLKNLLNHEGKLFCMTSIYRPGIDFSKWYYKNDNTHVFFYQEATFLYICERFGFSSVTIEGNLVTLTC